jgi:ABC-type arginine transport system permease subunit
MFGRGVFLKAKNLHSIVIVVPLQNFIEFSKSEPVITEEPFTLWMGASSIFFGVAAID